MEASSGAASHWMRDGILRRMAANGLVLLGGKSLDAVFSLATMAIAVRALGLEHYGFLVMIHAFAMAVAQICTFQSWQAVLRYGAPALQEQRFADFGRLLKFTALLDIASALAAATLAVMGAWLLIGPLLNWPQEILPLAAVYGLCVVFSMTATPVGILRLYNRFDLLAMQSSLGSLIRLLGAGLAVLAGGGLEAFLLVWFIATVTAGAMLIAGAWYEARRRGDLRGVSVGWRGLADPFEGIWPFVAATNMNGAAKAGFVHIGILMTGGLLGAAEAGLFRIARQLANALAKPARLLIQVIYPEFARLTAAGDVKGVRRLLARSVKLAGAGVALCVPILVFAGPLALELIGGEEARAAYPILLLLGVAAMIELWAFPLEPALISAGRAGSALSVRLAAILVSLPLLYVLAQEMGLIGAGLAILAGAAILFAGQGFWILRVLGKPRVPKQA